MTRSVRTRYPHAFSARSVPPVGEGSKPGLQTPAADQARAEDPDSRMWWKQKPKAPTYPPLYSRADIERIADRLAMVWDEQRGVRLGPQVAKLCEEGLRMLLSEPTRKQVMDIIRCERCAPDPDGPACSGCVARTNEIVRIFQDQRRKDWSL